VYRDRHGTEFCILTNADRTETQVFLPSDIKNARR
jgi:hypothetical protein